MPELSDEELDALAEEATIDAYDDGEQISGFAVMIDDNLEFPFETTVLGVTVTVKGVEQTDSGIVADCVRDGQHQPIPILDLPLVTAHCGATPFPRTICGDSPRPYDSACRVPKYGTAADLRRLELAGVLHATPALAKHKGHEYASRN